MERKFNIPFYEIIKKDVHGYECGREHCDDLVTAYRRFCHLIDIFPEYTINVNHISQSKIISVAHWPRK